MWWIRDKKVAAINKRITSILTKFVKLTKVVDSNQKRLKELEQLNEIKEKQIDSLTNILEEQKIMIDRNSKILDKLI